MLLHPSKDHGERIRPGEFGNDVLWNIEHCAYPLGKPS